MVSREPKISPSIGMMATLSPKTSPRAVASLLATEAIRAPNRMTPMKTTRQPLNAPKKSIPARDLRGGTAAIGVAIGSAMVSTGAVTGSSSVMGSALRRGLRSRSGFFGFRGVLFRRRDRGRMCRDLGFGQWFDVARREADLLVGPIDFDHAYTNGLAGVKGLVELRLRIARDLRDVRQPLDAIGHADEETEIGDLGHVADQLIADVVRLGEVVPFVRQELFDRQRQALVLAVDVDDPRLHGIALLQHLVGMLEAAVP